MTRAEEFKIISDIIDSISRLQYAQDWIELDKQLQKIDVDNIMEIEAVAWTRSSYPTRIKTPYWSQLVNRCVDRFGHELFKGLV